MKNVLFIFFAVILLSFSAGRVSSQTAQPAEQTKPAISAEKLALIKEYLRVAGGEENTGQKVLDSVIDLQMQEATKMANTLVDDDKSLNENDKQVVKKLVTETVDRTVAKLRDFFAKEISFDQLMDDLLVPVLDRNFNESELHELIAFYRTPTGQKTIKMAPELVVESMRAVSEKVLPKLFDYMKKNSDDEQVNLKKAIDEYKKTATRKTT